MKPKRPVLAGALSAAVLLGAEGAQEVIGASDAQKRDLSRLFYSDTLPVATVVAAPVAGPPPAAAPKPNPPKPPSAASPAEATKPVRRIGLKYQILLQGACGVVRVVSPSEAFHSGEKIRIQIEPNVDGHLYILQKGSSGRESLLFPNPAVNGGNNRVSRGVMYSTPDDSWFFFDGVPGEERLLVVLSRTPIDWLPQEMNPAPTRTAPLPMVTFAGAQSALDRSVASRDLLVFDQAGPASHGQAAPVQSRIAVNNSDQKNDVVYAEIVLKHI